MGRGSFRFEKVKATLQRKSARTRWVTERIASTSGAPESSKRNNRLESILL
jgi:hypothetical protein